MPIIIDDQNFTELDDGLLQAAPPFDIDIDTWTYDRNHIGYQAITDGYGDGRRTRILYVSTTGTGAMRLISLYNDLKKDGQDVGYIEGIPENDAMGEVYV